LVELAARIPARYRYRLGLPDLRERRPRYVGLGEPRSSFGSAARLGSLTHAILEAWGRGRIDGRPLGIDAAFERAALEFADVPEDDAASARARASRAMAFLAGYELLDVERAFAITVGEVVVEGAIDVIARGPDGRVYVIDYKTGTTGDEHDALQLALYVRAVAEVYPRDRVSGPILRLTPTCFELALAPALSDEAIETAVSDARGSKATSQKSASGASVARTTVRRVTLVKKRRPRRGPSRARHDEAIRVRLSGRRAYGRQASTVLPPKIMRLTNGVKIMYGLPGSCALASSNRRVCLGSSSRCNAAMLSAS